MMGVQFSLSAPFKYEKKMKELIEKFFESPQPKLINDNDLSEALYSISELGLWPDGDDSMSIEQASFVWQIVETLREKRLPNECRM